MKLRILILTILAALIVPLCAVTAMSASRSGHWNIPPVWGPPVQQICVTPRAVYYLSGGSLFCRDLDNDQNIPLGIGNRLSTSAPVTGIYYNPWRGYLAATYSNGAIDMLYDNGRNVCLDDIAIAELNGVNSRSIRSMTFDPEADRLYAGTDFGLVVFDDVLHQVVTSGNYGVAVDAVALSAGNIIIHADHKFYGVPSDGRLNTFDSYTFLLSWYTVSQLMTIDRESGLLAMVSDGDRKYVLATLLPSVSDGTFVFHNLGDNLGAQSSGRLQQGPNGFYYMLDGNIYTLGTDGVLGTPFPLPDELADNLTGTRDGRNIFGLDMDGLIHCVRKGDGWAVASQRFAPADMPVRNAVTMSVSPDGRRLYVGNLGPTNYRMGYITGDEGLQTVQTTGCIDLTDGSVCDVTAYPAPASFAETVTTQNRLGQYPIAPTHLCEDPDNSSVYWLGTGNDGLYRIADGQLDGRYDQSNAPFAPEWGCRVYDVSVDRGGNLWVMSNTVGGSGVAVLPAAKRKLHPDEVTAADWIVPVFDGYKSNKDVVTLHCRKSNMILITDAGVSNRLLAIDTKGTWDNTDDDTVMLWSSFTDQDGKTFAPDRHASLCEDNDGRVWMGTNIGVISFNPSQATDASMRVTRIKVPRNDGTNTADYLASSDLVLGIAADAANRKWLATDASGVMLVSPSGDAILDHITADNSQLPSDRVNAIHVSPFDGVVRMATSAGLAEYTPGGVSVATDGVPDIYAYPNPVRPDFGGNVTVTGLQDGMLVKFADASGNVLYQTRAAGGTASWDLCNVAGRRVPSGVYYVLSSSPLSSSASSSASSMICKFLVIN